MSPLLSCQSLSKSFGSRLLFEDLSLSLFSGDRVGLIGPNGSGKSTLLKMIAGNESIDAGIVSMNKGLHLGYVPQTCDFPDLSPFQILLQTLSEDMPEYEKEVLVKTWLSKLGFDHEEPSAARLSGGWKKRLAFAVALIQHPDVLLLDEPTNHLDLEGIVWLEKFLLREAPTYLLVSHDRFFLQHVTNRIIEIDRTYPRGTFAIDGSYFHFLEKKEAFLLGQLEQERSLASKARREVEWLRQSPKARTTKSRSRVEDAQELLQDLSDVKNRNQKKRANITFEASERETRKLLTAKNLGKNIADRTLFKHLEFTLSPGTRIGLMGPNGSGKTTLLRLIAGEISPDQGTLKRADDLQVVYFDQHRKQLPSYLTLREALSPNGDFVMFRGRPVHVNGWCKRFLFSPDILDMPLEKLSGGERARISIAHLMLQPADVLLLDEPTNDLDIPTLETLEESLIDFPGAVVLITHDRYMLDRICNLLIALGNSETVGTYADYPQWETAQKNLAVTSSLKEKSPKKEKPSTSKPKLTYKERQEYELIEGNILKLEQEVHMLNMQLEKEASNPSKLQEICTAISITETKIEQLYLRWEFLDQKETNSH